MLLPNQLPDDHFAPHEAGAGLDIGRESRQQELQQQQQHQQFQSVTSYQPEPPALEPLVEEDEDQYHWKLLLPEHYVEPLQEQQQEYHYQDADPRERHHAPPPPPWRRPRKSWLERAKQSVYSGWNEVTDFVSSFRLKRNFGL